MAKTIMPTELTRIYVVMPRHQVVLANKHQPNGPPTVRNEGEVIYVEELDDKLAKNFLDSGRIKSLSNSNEYEAEEMDRLLNPKKRSTTSVVALPKPSYSLDPEVLQGLSFDELVKIFTVHTSRLDHPDNKADIIEELSKNFVAKPKSNRVDDAAEPTMDVDTSSPPPPLN